MPPDPDYEAFRRMNHGERLRAFNEMSPHARAELVKTQIRWWIDGHRSRLTSQQIAILEENIDFLRAELYELPRSADFDAQKQELIARTAALLDFDQMAQALTIHGADIPEFSDAELELAGFPADRRVDLEICAARAATTVARVRIHAAEGVVAEREIVITQAEQQERFLTSPARCSGSRSGRR